MVIGCIILFIYGGIEAVHRASNKSHKRVPSFNVSPIVDIEYKKRNINHVDSYRIARARDVSPKQLGWTK
jgi:hypothetical protein